MHECANHLIVRAAVILLAGMLAAAAAHAQDRPTTAIEGKARGARSRVFELAARAADPESGADSSADGFDNQANDQSDLRQSAGQSEAEPGNFADMDEFVTNDDVYESPIGALLQHDCARLGRGQTACGLAVLEVHPGTPAAAAGLRPYSGLGHTLLGATVVGAAMVFPPAIAALGLVDQSHIGESFDLIIGFDGQRIREIRDFQAAVSQLRVGDLIYLTVVRGGKRLQMRVRVTLPAP